MITEELMKTFTAIERLYMGVDISTIPVEDFMKAGDSPVFCGQLDEESVKLLDLPTKYLRRTGKTLQAVSDTTMSNEGTEVNVTICYSSLLAVMRTLKSLGVCGYSYIDEEILDPSILQRLQEIDNSFDYTKALDCDIKNNLKMSDTDMELKTLLALCQYPDGLAKKFYDITQQPRKFVLKDFKDFEVSDNRIIIPLSEADKYRLKKHLNKIYGADRRLYNMQAIVISKNPVDYFFCSYGNSFQSCFALNSSMGYWYGYVPYCMTDESFIVYATTGEVMKTGVIRGSKFHNPQMLWRAWGYATEDGSLCIDKKYRGTTTGTDSLIEFCCNWLTQKFNVICDRHGAKCRTLYNQGKGLYKISEEYRLKVYSDSLKRYDDSSVMFQYGAGQSFPTDYTPDWKNDFNSFINWAGTVVEVDKSLDISLPIMVKDGVLSSVKVCPITGMKIPLSSTQHPFAKYFTTPSKKTAFVTYERGRFKLLDTTSYTSFGSIITCSNANISSIGSSIILSYSESVASDRVALKTFKETLKGAISNSAFDAILLRVVEDDKVTCQVFRKKGNKQ